MEPEPHWRDDRLAAGDSVGRTWLESVHDSLHPPAARTRPFNLHNSVKSHFQLKLPGRPLFDEAVQGEGLFQAFVQAVCRRGVQGGAFASYRLEGRTGLIEGVPVIGVLQSSSHALLIGFGQVGEDVFPLVPLAALDQGLLVVMDGAKGLCNMAGHPPRAERWSAVAARTPPSSPSF